MRLKGVPVRANAVISLQGRCAASVDEAQDDIVATAVVRDTQVTPVVWGDLRACATPTEQGLVAQLWGAFEVYIPTLLSKRTPIYLIRYELTRVQVAGLALPGWAGDLRYVGDLLEILVTSPDGYTAVLSGGPGTRVGVRAANGEWECLLEERRCQAQGSEESFLF